MLKMNCDCLVCQAYALGRLQGRVDGIKAMTAHPAPVAMVLFCPHCKEQHIERGKWKTTPHRTHACYRCHKPFTPASVQTFGVEYKELVFEVIDPPRYYGTEQDDEELYEEIAKL